MPKKRTSRVYWRGGRAYVDLRDFADVLQPGEPDRLALVAQHEKSATTDPDVAAELAGTKVKELEERRRNRTLLGVERIVHLEAFADHHLVMKKREGRVTDGWLEETEHQLDRAVEYFGAARELTAVKPRDVRDFVAWLGEQKAGRGDRTLSPGTVRHHLNALSNLYRRAAEEGCVPPAWNPVAALTSKPSAARQEAKWLEVHDASLLLEAARTYKPKRPDVALPDLYAIVGTLLLTGGRKSEVLGLTAEDVSFDRGTVTFRPHEHRRLKTSTSHRAVPLYPQLREILQEHVFGKGRVSGLLFPSPKPQKDPEAEGPGMVWDLRKALDAIGERAGWAAGEIRTKMFRHTYCAAALQLLDRGAPVSPWTVAKWMGHGGQSLVNRVYGHLGEVRHRAEVVEYRVQQHRAKLGDRLKQLAR